MIKINAFQSRFNRTIIMIIIKKKLIKQAWSKMIVQLEKTEHNVTKGTH